MGVNRDRVIRLTFVIGGAMAGAAAMMYLIRIGQIRYNSGFLLGVKAFTAAVLGGIGNLRGALLGGFILGVAENYGQAIFGWRVEGRRRLHAARRHPAVPTHRPAR